MSANIDLETVRAEYEGFPERFDTLLMATVSSEGEPNASYAAYVRQGSDFYVYISELAAHTRNLKEQGKVSVFFIENETDSKNLFARKRTTYQCTAHHMPRDEAEFAPMMEKFSQKFGNMIDTLRDMKDFHLYRLHPHKATYVSGFARAFVVEGAELDNVRHINDVGHRAANKDVGERFDQLQNENTAA
ncbi:MAG: pyridoxamine 5'-phosphate oxidase family protein [Thiobacillus sp.]|nr:pyridoxamine 5'-phosphate oxidase family protein [Thiobacillus sp.]